MNHPPIIQGIGGVFLYANDVETLAPWYTTHLGIEWQAWGKVRFAEFPSADVAPAGRQSSTVFSLMQADSPLPAGLRTGRVNLRVSDMDGLVARLREAGMEVEGPGEPYLGRFAWVHDPEGNRIELWEPPTE